MHLAQGVPQEAYVDMNVQKELLRGTQRSWKTCQDELRSSKAEVRDLREEVSGQKVVILSTRNLRASHSDFAAKNQGLKATITEFRDDELKQHAEQFDWQFTGGAGSNAEARQSEPKARGGNMPTKRPADDDDDEGGEDTVSFPSRHTVVDEVIDVRAKEVDRVDVASWPMPGNFRTWRMNLVDRVLATSVHPNGAFR